MRIEWQTDLLTVPVVATTMLLRAKTSSIVRVQLLEHVDGMGSLASASLPRGHGSIRTSREKPKFFITRAQNPHYPHRGSNEYDVNLGIH